MGRGRCPPDLAERFLIDVVSGMSNAELSKKYDRSKRSIRDWKFCLREEGKLQRDLEVPRASVALAITGNYATATSTDRRVRTEDDLRAACGIDRKRWHCYFFECGTYEGFAKNEKKGLSFDRGMITGSVESDGVIVVPMFRTKARFVLKEPEPLRPTIQPMQAAQTYPIEVFSVKASGRALILADPHLGFMWNPPDWRLVPFHNRAVLDAFVQLVSAVKPDVVVVLGDLLDLSTWQDKFARRPGYYHTTQPAIVECHHFLARIRKASPTSEVRAHSGNHDERMDSATLTHLREALELKPANELHLDPVLSVPRLLALQDLGVQWVGGYPDDLSWLGEAVECRHGHIARQKDLTTVTALLERATSHRVCGHIHRDEMVSRRPPLATDTRSITAYCPGCACWTDGRIPGSTSMSNWRNGTGIIDWHGQDASFYHLPMNDGVVVWDGNVYIGSDDVSELQEAYPKWNW